MATTMSLLEIFRSGGPIMWPLVIFSLVTVAIIIERSINLRSSRIVDRGLVERVTALAESGRPDRAANVCRETPGMFASILLPGLDLAHKGEVIAKEAVEDAGRHEATRLTRYLGALGTVAAVSPLLGLLGTVTGMIEVFDTISRQGAGNAAELSSGISQALITTATGLLVAIPALIAHNYFHAKVEWIMADLEGSSLRALHGLYRATEAEDGGTLSVDAAGASGIGS
jgi:biopolymer transport protein ExbB